ncbi:2-oxo-tetronate isomerase [uncultured Methylibium sp.]|uniref:2-oxo-tetronate isomerase n=1 Tax=uncultured Methylibium sp. TaxID=381093 RepID=UPI00260144FE|nr:2-oxo-tetronate isomerase [uncultured Methylibium sp.]
MPRLAANLSMLYTEHPFLERAAAAARDGFEAVEWQFAYEHAPAALRSALGGLPLVLMNAPPGDAAAGERGLAALPGREEDFRRSIAQALDLAEALRCPRVHVLAGRMPPGTERAALQPTFVANLAWAAPRAAAAGVTLLIEPINGRDIPGYFLNRQDHAHEIVAAVGAPNLKVQMDLYHCQVVEGDVATKLRSYLPTGRVGHLQVAGVPERQEPDVGELNCRYLFDVIDELGWDGWIGCEYRPRGSTSEGLGWRSTR